MIAITTLLPLAVGIPSIRVILNEVDAVVERLQYERAFSLGHSLIHLIGARILGDRNRSGIGSDIFNFAEAESDVLYVVALSSNDALIAQVCAKKFPLNTSALVEDKPGGIKVLRVEYEPVEGKSNHLPGGLLVHHRLFHNLFRGRNHYYHRVAVPIGEPPTIYVHFGLEASAGEELIASIGSLLSVLLAGIVVAGPLLVLTMHRRPFVSSEQRSLQSEALLEISRVLLTTESLESVLDQIVRHVADVLRSPRVCLLLRNDVSERLEPKATCGLPTEFRDRIGLEEAQSALHGQMAQNRILRFSNTKDFPMLALVEAGTPQPPRCCVAAPLDTRGKPIGLLLLFRDSDDSFSHDELQYLETFSRLAALAIEHSALIAKSAQIPEIHHRVKNHLQDVANLLSLELHRLSTPDARQPLENTLNRLKGLSVAYDLLARHEQDEFSNEQSGVNLKEVFSELSSKVWQINVPPDKRVKIEVLGDDVVVPARKATSVGMVVNELAANAMKHGFVSKPEGTLRILLHRSSGDIRISVSDNGSGLPRDFDPKTNARLGLTIVQTLVERDLGGQLAFRNDDGTTVEISLHF